MRHSKPVRLGNLTYRSTVLVGTVSNSADAVRLGNRAYRGAKVSIYF